MKNRVLHVRSTAGISQILSKYQKNLGYISDTLEFKGKKYSLKTDYYYPRKTKLPLGFENFFYIKKVSSKYDILHFHDFTATATGFDLPFLKMKRKKIIVHYHGSSIRGKREKKLYKTFSDIVFVSTPDLLEYVDDGIWIPNPVDFEKLKYVGVNDNSEEIRIIHVPSNREIKGTDHIVKAIKKLIKEGCKIDFILLENTAHDEVLKLLNTADIVIDWVNTNYGIYGMVSVESMALGKPVICSIDERLIDKYYKDLPIFNVNYENLVGKIRILIEDRNLRRKLAENGRKYVEKIHDGEKIAKKVISYY